MMRFVGVVYFCLTFDRGGQWPRPGLEPGPLDPESNAISGLFQCEPTMFEVSILLVYFASFFLTDHVHYADISQVS